MPWTWEAPIAAMAQVSTDAFRRNACFQHCLNGRRDVEEGPLLSVGKYRAYSSYCRNHAAGDHEGPVQDYTTSPVKYWAMDYIHIYTVADSRRHRSYRRRFTVLAE